VTKLVTKNGGIVHISQETELALRGRGLSDALWIEFDDDATHVVQTFIAGDIDEEFLINDIFHTDDIGECVFDSLRQRVTPQHYAKVVIFNKETSETVYSETGSI
jgi:hypothetical protein